jgi:putative endonuclease
MLPLCLKAFRFLLVSRKTNMTVKKEAKKVGQIGEDVGCTFLKKHKFKIVDRNYRKKWGEIDVVAQKDNILHFIEIKTVSRENLDIVLCEISDYRPEENVHPWKIKRLSRAIQTYLLEKDISEEKEWQLDVLAVFLNLDKGQARCRLTENIVL